MTTDTLLREQDLGYESEDVDAELAFHSEFPQVHLPFQITIGGLTMEGISISLTKALVAGRLPPDLEYQDELVSLRFDFDGFSVTLFADAILSQDVQDPQAPVSVFFTHPTDGHLSPLRYLVNSFIAGDTVTLGQLLSTGAAPSQVSPQVARKAQGGSLVSWTTVMLALLGLLFGFAATDLVYQRVILTQEARPLVITQDVQTLRATASGQIAMVNPDAAEGEVAYTLITNRGDFLSLRMPCDCASELADGAFAGATVLGGDPILTLLPQDSTPVAYAQLSQRGLERYLAGDQAEVVFASGRVVPVALRMDTSKAQPRATIVWPHGVSVPSGGTIARLRFNKLNGRMARSVKSRLSELVALIPERN